MAQAKREKAKPKPKPKFTDKAQSERFIEAARIAHAVENNNLEIFLDRVPTLLPKKN
jgi:hypothetical protein